MASDEDDDYMNMTFGEEPPKPTETSLQRRQRLKREGEIKAHAKSKAVLAAEEREAREAALSKSLLEDAAAKKSKGLAMMAKMGFKKGGTLGSVDNAENARREPIRPEMKDDRGGIGLDSERKRKLDEVVEEELKRVRVDENEFRDRVRREREQARNESLVYAAMKVCERMDEEAQAHAGGAYAEAKVETEAGETAAKKKKKKTLSTRPLKSIPVVWRGLIRRREEAERDRRMKYDLEQSSSTSRLPTYEDDLEEEDDKRAMGKLSTTHAQVEDLDEEDPELDEFNALEAGERLRLLVEYLRKEYLYCFWCKCGYEDDAMEGCPGITEEEHD
ncbi:Uu.00g046630.m01.CDS01 [Anthostomella pinea]|uniref:Uu.00g046630.m01.CDS01 n=1 Tax=Anthostomella pinea TaxID=933095 RepID=A0AAI8YEI1_9PEZI|nr:Uu.00g046630.m01.CDS01 [Anthostomella pinea]